jgi:hypothetical protein
VADCPDGDLCRSNVAGVGGVRQRKEDNMKALCENCRFWSQMCAPALDGGPIEALCLSDDGPKAGQYTRATNGCPAWKINSHGSIDEPPNYGEKARAAYEAEEGGA